MQRRVTWLRGGGGESPGSFSISPEQEGQESGDPLRSLAIRFNACAGLYEAGRGLRMLSPVLALQFDLSASATGVLMLSLLLGTPILSLVGAMGAALTVGLRGSSVLLSLLVLPLTIPVLIFGAGAVEAHTAGLGVAGHFSLLGALLIVGLIAAPWVTAAALRISVD